MHITGDKYFWQSLLLFNPFETQLSGIPSLFQAQNSSGAAQSLPGASHWTGSPPALAVSITALPLESAWPRVQEVPELGLWAWTSPSLGQWAGRGWRVGWKDTDLGMWNWECVSNGDQGMQEMQALLVPSCPSPSFMGRGSSSWEIPVPPSSLSFTGSWEQSRGAARCHPSGLKG